MSRRYVIIGGDAAGMSAASQIRRLDPDATIDVFERDNVVSYAQCGLPYYIGGLVPSAERLVARTKQEFEEKYNIRVHLRHEATAVDPTAKIVAVTDLATGDTRTVPYDKLLIATGARPILPGWEGRDLAGVFPLKTLGDAERILADLRDRPVERVVIIGGGYIGLEMAEAFHLLGKTVTVLDLAPQLALTFDADMADLARDALERHGIAVGLGEEVRRLEGEGGRVRAVVTNKNTYPADLVLVAVGVVPNSELAREAGAELGPKGAIRVNDRMETSLPDVYAAGDCATQFHRIKGADDFVPLGTHANKQGRVAGTNMTGGDARFAGIVGSAIMKVLDIAMGRTGLSSREAEALGVPFETVRIRSRAHARYYPDNAELHVKLLFRRDDRRLLGGQIVGKAGVDKRVDVLATALYHGMTIDELEALDLSYAPPFNAVWDPLQQAATVAKKADRRAER
ncbi:MAG: CoA-disulfide reductase [Hydrogenibacillus schlegelii]|uniref:CoA-disulfide reductase n=1 Tax=Hydrogenibacillus schlegelii TaxID=1484 RepID=A0A947G9M9_HYDSH|nr:CoA-disulfide reductase [Hydrogenibacillus schlegelii]